LIPTLTDDEFDFRIEEWAKRNRGFPIGSVSGATGYLKERLDQEIDAAVWPEWVETMERAICPVMQNKVFSRLIKRHYLGKNSISELSSCYHVPENDVKLLIAEVKGLICENVYLIENNLEIA